MINLTQVILVAVITTLTILLTFIGIQVVYILKDLRETIQRINRVAGHAEAITSAVVRPIAGMSSLLEGIQSSLKIAELLGYVKNHAKKTMSELPGQVGEHVQEVKADIQEARDQLEEHFHEPHQQMERTPKPRSVFPRFFHRSGTPLG